ncbi:Arm DNA-binding domain-containing protein [Qipengyuania gelatinilytica]|uniref:Arm DNA-binding domain-containing protein n=1 Tax=Qipengyuania gelatinilytica TaxID=2867231 RepID=A0ABX9A4M5_9SPHN|nr:Arm DNA-binding domain-containing protein [Qipengyuania gelatinilytica]
MTINWKHQNLVGIAVEKHTEHRHPTVEGLTFRIAPSGRKTWLFERMANGKRHKKTMGRFPAMSMAEA